MKIGLTYTGSDKKHNYYKQWLEGNDEDIHVIKLSEVENNATTINDCDALVLSGGIDINPELYRGKKEYPNKPERFNDQRDDLESSVFSNALERKIPVLGICRGLQLINVLLNGTLVQDLDAGNKTHEGGPDKEHEIQIEKDSLLYQLTGTLSGAVNSAHHQAIDKLGDGLKINCRAADGTIEGIEWLDPKQKSFLLGIQWHAERMFFFNLQNSPLSAGIRNQFIQEIRNTKR